MNIKEFSREYGLAFFWSTVILALLLIVQIILGFTHGPRGDRGPDMRGDRLMPAQTMQQRQGQPQVPQNQQNVQGMPTDNTAPLQ